MFYVEIAMLVIVLTVSAGRVAYRRGYKNGHQSGMDDVHRLFGE
jgi:hypothetical protein